MINDDKIKIIEDIKQDMAARIRIPKEYLTPHVRTYDIHLNEKNEIITTGTFIHPPFKTLGPLGLNMDSEGLFVRVRARYLHEAIQRASYIAAKAPIVLPSIFQMEENDND